MKYLLLLIPFIVLACSDTPTGQSMHYRVFQQKGIITPADLGNRNAFAVAMSGDTLFVAAFDSTSNAVVLLFSFATGQRLAELHAWNNDSATFAGYPTSLAVDSQFLYVGEKDSRTTVFRRQDLMYYTTVGTGVWWGEDSLKMVHSFGLARIDSLLLVRDKSSLRAFTVSDITPALAWKVPLFAKSRELATNTSHHGIVGRGDTLFVTDNGNHQLYLFAHSDFHRGNQNIAPIDSVDLGFAPLGIVLHGDEILLTDGNGKIQSRSARDGTWLRDYSVIEGHNFNSPSAIAGAGDNLAIVEQAQGAVILATIRYTEVTLY